MLFELLIVLAASGTFGHAFLRHRLFLNNASDCAMSVCVELLRAFCEAIGHGAKVIM